MDLSSLQSYSDLSPKDLACNANANPSSNLCEVNRKLFLPSVHERCVIKPYPIAGDLVTVEMHQQPGDRSCSTEAIGGDHYGPVMVRIALFSRNILLINEKGLHG